MPFTHVISSVLVQIRPDQPGSFALFSCSSCMNSKLSNVLYFFGLALKTFHRFARAKCSPLYSFRVLCANILFQLPLIREICLWTGCIDGKYVFSFLFNPNRLLPSTHQHSCCLNLNSCYATKFILASVKVTERAISLGYSLLIIPGGEHEQVGSRILNGSILRLLTSSYEFWYQIVYTCDRPGLDCSPRKNDETLHAAHSFSITLL